MVNWRSVTLLVRAESYDEDDNPTPKPPSHAETVDASAKLRFHLESTTDGHQYLPYVNAIKNLASQQEFNSTKKTRCFVTDVFLLNSAVIEKHIEIKDITNCCSSSNQIIGGHLVRVFQSWWTHHKTGSFSAIIAHKSVIGF